MLQLASISNPPRKCSLVLGFSCRVNSTSLTWTASVFLRWQKDSSLKTYPVSKGIKEPTPQRVGSMPSTDDLRQRSHRDQRLGGRRPVAHLLAPVPAE